MSNLDPPRDPLMVWTAYGNVRIGDRKCSPHYVLATLTPTQAADLAISIFAMLGPGTRQTGGWVSGDAAHPSTGPAAAEGPLPPKTNKTGGPA